MYRNIMDMILGIKIQRYWWCMNKYKERGGLP